MSVRLLLAAPDTAHVVAATSGYVLGSGRTVPTVAAVLSLISVVLGGSALARSARRVGDGGRPTRTVGALALGLAGTTVGGLHATFSAGGLGTGNGLAGAVVAVVLGLVGAALAGVALTRFRRYAGAVTRRTTEP